MSVNGCPELFGLRSKSLLDSCRMGGNLIGKDETAWIELETLTKQKEAQLEFSTVENYKMGNQPYEGMMRSNLRSGSKHIRLT